MRIFILPALALTLTACASTPKTDMLTQGLDQSAMQSVVPDKAMRQSSDPVCAQFYVNAQNYIHAANTPSQGSRFMTNVGVSVLSAVVGSGVGAGIGSQVGRVAVQSAASQAIYQGSGIALQELSKDSTSEAKVIETAAQLRCPVALKAG
ncbi:hypothetical protein [Fretibacter rubidus]|uniref:hypothetical protein n=1 Tax=Fretibacter rubidus TaxID=570162 RepID=UPI00352B0C74